MKNTNEPTINSRVALRNTIIFAALVNGLAWLGPLLGGSPTVPGPGLLVWGTAPILAILIMRWGLGDHVALGLRPAFRGNVRGYLLSLLIYPLSILGVFIVGLWLQFITLNDLTPAAFVMAMAEPVAIYFIFAIFEEVGWRGYLTPRIAAWNDGLWGYVILGLIWASWHFPYMAELWAHMDESLMTLIPRFLIGTIISAIVYGEIRKRTGTVWPAILMHWMGNTIANTLLTGFVIYTPGTEWLASFGVSGLFMMIIFGSIGELLYRRRARHQQAKQSPASELQV